MLEYTRLDHIMAYLQEHHTATVVNLAKRLYASEATIRRDLTTLEQRGLLKRLHGGAVLVDDAHREVPLYMREQQNVQAKKAIAAKAAEHLRDGQVIFLDASSTAMLMIPYFENYQNLTIITNGLKTAQELSRLSHKTYCTGGLMLHNSSAYVGSYAADFVRHFNADIFFFSSRGLTEDGRITDASSEENHIRQVMLQNSRMHVFLCDSSKIGKLYCYNLCTVKDVTDWITDRNKPQQKSVPRGQEL